MCDYLVSSMPDLIIRKQFMQKFHLVFVVFAYERGRNIIRIMQSFVRENQVLMDGGDFVSLISFVRGNVSETFQCS